MTRLRGMADGKMGKKAREKGERRKWHKGKCRDE